MSELFINHLRKNLSSPLKRVNSIFIRREYHKDAGNISHIHSILEILWINLNEALNKRVKYLIRASIIDTVDSNEVQYFIDRGIFEFIDDHRATIEGSKIFLPQRCNPRCLMRIVPGPNDFSAGS